MKQSAHDALSPCHWLNLCDSADFSGLVMSYAITNSSSTKLCFHEPTLIGDRRRRHRTLVADLSDDISHVCNFVSQDSSLPHIREKFNHACSLFVIQAGDLGCFKCPNCAKPYISATWYQKHLSNALSSLG